MSGYISSQEPGIEYLTRPASNAASPLESRSLRIPSLGANDSYGGARYGETPSDPYSDQHARLAQIASSMSFYHMLGGKSIEKPVGITVLQIPHGNGHISEINLSAAA